MHRAQNSLSQKPQQIRPDLICVDLRMQPDMAVIDWLVLCSVEEAKLECRWDINCELEIS